MTKTTVSPKIQEDIKPGQLISANIRLAGNGGCILSWEFAPDKKEKDMPFMYSRRRDDAYGSIEEACHAIVQAAGGSSEYVDEEKDEKAA